MIPNLDRNSGEDPVIGIDDRTLYNTGSVQDPAGIDEELLDPFLTMVQNMLSAKETAQNQLQTLIESRLSQYGESDPAEYIKVRGRIRKHPGDRDRANAVKVNEDRAKMLALMFRDLARLGTYSHAVATEAHYKMAERNRQYPQDTQGYGQLLSQFTGLQIAYALREMMTMFPNMSLAGIAQTTNNPKR